MTKKLIASIAASALILAACQQSQTPQGTGGPTGTALATGSPGAAGSPTGSPATTGATKYVKLQVVAPEPNARAGINGTGWTVDIVAKGNGPAMDRIEPAFQTSTTPGRNPAFPGLVVLVKTTTGGQTSTNADRNLARLFQVIGLPNTLGGTASISSANTPTSSPGATGATGATGGTGATGATGARPTATAAVGQTSTDTDTATATWFVQQSLWGTDVDVELTVFVVEGEAPDTVSDRGSLRIVSDEITVRFHINGGGQPSGTAAPSATPRTSPSASPTTGASPSPSPTSTP